MKTLYLPLKKEWYEMIERGEKPEEYRAIVTYWMTRLLDCFPMFNMPTDDGQCLEEGITIGRGRPEWGAPEHTTFIIKLGKRL